MNITQFNKDVETAFNNASLNNQAVIDLTVVALNQAIKKGKPDYLASLLNQLQLVRNQKSADFAVYIIPFIKKWSPYVLGNGKKLTVTKTRKSKNALKRIEKFDPKAVKNWVMTMEARRYKANKNGSSTQSTFTHAMAVDTLRDAILGKVKSLSNSKRYADGETPLTRAETKDIINKALESDDFKSIAFTA